VKIIRYVRYKILRFHGGDYEERQLLECGSVKVLYTTDVSEEGNASILKVKRTKKGKLSVTSI
jgi:hypothetical protein